jgi:hypothetical protein
MFVGGLRSHQGASTYLCGEGGSFFDGPHDQLVLSDPILFEYPQNICGIHHTPVDLHGFARTNRSGWQGPLPCGDAERPKLAPSRRGGAVARCPLSEAKQKTSALSENFAF